MWLLLVNNCINTYWRGPNHSKVVRHISDSNCKKKNPVSSENLLPKVWDYKVSDKSLDESTWIHETIHFPKVGDDVMNSKRFTSKINWTFVLVYPLFLTSVK